LSLVFFAAVPYPYNRNIQPSKLVVLFHLEQIALLNATYTAWNHHCLQIQFVAWETLCEMHL